MGNGCAIVTRASGRQRVARLAWPRSGGQFDDPQFAEDTSPHVRGGRVRARLDGRGGAQEERQDARQALEPRLDRSRGLQGFREEEGEREIEEGEEGAEEGRRIDG